jgi:hypothetical protein
VSAQARGQSAVLGRFAGCFWSTDVARRETGGQPTPKALVAGVLRFARQADVLLLPHVKHSWLLPIVGQRASAPSGVAAWQWRQPEGAGAVANFRPNRNQVEVEAIPRNILIPLRMADGVGFEPTVRLHARRFSRPLPSTARPPIPLRTNYAAALCISSVDGR